ncbi:hypothetical protein LAN29_25355, partial [Mycobacterium tuberculosis]|nr:hypothetical protein [Mycobacterium tuberculosis]
MEIISEWHDGAAVPYRESQTLADSSQNVRWSTAIFQQAEGKIVWRDLQGTRLASHEEKGPDFRGGVVDRKRPLR